jgi:outer membrane receptor protein involved in Fe transport
MVRQVRQVFVVLVVLWLAGRSAPLLAAQVATGNLYGTVTDNQGVPLPGVIVRIEGGGASQVQVTDGQGWFRFLVLDAGRYSVRAELEGFGTVEWPDVAVLAGRNREIRIALRSGVKDYLTVTDESSIIDERRVATGSSVSAIELEKIPTARDPWSILQQTPGVLTDRINVGGNESVQPQTFTGPGSEGGNTVWAVDGVVITDMAALGSSPVYYNFDSFEEMQVTTGGSDPTIATGGVVISMVTRRGTNEWRGAGGYYMGKSPFRSDRNVDTDLLGRGQAPEAIRQPELFDQYLDIGGNFGGPLAEDKLWIWGSYGSQKVDIVRNADGLAIDRDLETYVAKLNAQLGAGSRLTGEYLRFDFTGSGLGADDPFRSAFATSNLDGPTNLYRVEDTHIFNSNFYLTGMASFVDGGFKLVSQGGDQPAFVDSTGVVFNAFRSRDAERRSDQARIDGNYLFDAGTTAHELRFGFGYRHAVVESESAWPGSGLIGFDGARFGLPPGQHVALVAPGLASGIDLDYTALYASDTLRFGRLTANIGVRFDRQTGRNRESVRSANPMFPDIVPEARFAGNDADGLGWTDITPRLGLTYALGERRSTLLRASYSRFADQLGAAVPANTNPFLGTYAYFYGAFAWSDNNGNRVFDAGEPRSTVVPGPLSPAGSFLSAVGENADLSAPMTNEFLFGAEHELRPGFAVGGMVTIRKATGLLDRLPIISVGGSQRAAVANDYGLVAAETGTIDIPGSGSTTYSAPIYSLLPGREFTGTSLLRNGDREQEYRGVSVTFNKRLANRWMLRGHVTWSDWSSNTPAEFTSADDPNDAVLPHDNDGAPFAQQSRQVGKRGVFIGADWSYNVNGLVELPWGLNASANVSGRQGYANPAFLTIEPPDGRARQVALTSFDRFRHDDVFLADARLDKAFVSRGITVIVSIEGFNLFNRQTVLQRELDQTSPRANFIDEIISPRTFRMGTRIIFR